MVFDPICGCTLIVWALASVCAIDRSRSIHLHAVLGQ